VIVVANQKNNTKFVSGHVTQLATN